MHYEGHAFNDAFDKGKASGRITLNREGFTFRNETADVTLPLNTSRQVLCLQIFARALERFL